MHKVAYPPGVRPQTGEGPDPRSLAGAALPTPPPDAVDHLVLSTARVKQASLRREVPQTAGAYAQDRAVALR